MPAPSPKLAGALLWVLSCAALACHGGARPGSALALTGAGATFPYPLYSKWFSDYSRQSGAEINYQPIGSGGGIRQFTQGTVDFGATDAPMNQEQLDAVQGRVLHLPTVMGAVAVTYNLSGVMPLQLDGPAIADIFLGKITQWNDRRIAALNPAVRLPDEEIVVVHRSDGSGTSYIFTHYLSAVSAEWKERVGSGESVNWPAGLGGRGNEGVTAQVKQSEGAIGYVELVYASANKLPYARVKNAAGAFVEPSIASVTAAAAIAKFEPTTDFRVSIINAPGADAYPIASFTWLLVAPDMQDTAKARVLKGFLEWMLTEPAQQMAATLQYAPLPPPVVTLVRDRIMRLKALGKPIS